MRQPSSESPITAVMASGRATSWRSRRACTHGLCTDCCAPWTPSAEAPGHDPHPDGKNAWALRYAGEDQQRYKIDEVYAAGALLFGRVTYDIFASFWPTAPNDEGFADRMNSIPKCVASGTLKEARRNNTTIINGAWVRPGA